MTFQSKAVKSRVLPYSFCVSPRKNRRQLKKCSSWGWCFDFVRKDFRKQLKTSKCWRPCFLFWLLIESTRVTVIVSQNGWRFKRKLDRPLCYTWNVTISRSAWYNVNESSLSYDFRSRFLRCIMNDELSDVSSFQFKYCTLSDEFIRQGVFEKRKKNNIKNIRQSSTAPFSNIC